MYVQTLRSTPIAFYFVLHAGNPRTSTNILSFYDDPRLALAFFDPGAVVDRWAPLCRLQMGASAHILHDRAGLFNTSGVLFIVPVKAPEHLNSADKLQHLFPTCIPTAGRRRCCRRRTATARSTGSSTSWAACCSPTCQQCAARAQPSAPSGRGSRRCCRVLMLCWTPPTHCHSSHCISCR